MRVLESIAVVLATTGDVWVFRAPAALLDSPRSALPVAVGVAILAGLSTMLGHAVVFAINHVSGMRMAAAMALGALYMALLRTGTAATIALLAWLVARGRVDGETIAVTYLLAVAPHALGVLVFVPHLGRAIGRLLEVWSLLCLVVILAHALGVGAAPAVAIGGGAWLASQVISRLLARPLARASSRLWTLATGRRTFLTAQDILTGAPFVPLQHRELHA